MTTTKKLLLRHRRTRVTLQDHDPSVLHNHDPHPEANFSFYQTASVKEAPRAEADVSPFGHVGF